MFDWGKFRNFALVKPKDVHQPFGLTCTFDCVRGAKHVVTRQTKGHAPTFGLTCTFDFERGAMHVVSRNQKRHTVSHTALTAPLDVRRTRLAKLDEPLRIKGV